MRGKQPFIIDARIYGCIANIYFCDMTMPLMRFMVAHGNIVRRRSAIHAQNYSILCCGNLNRSRFRHTQ